MRSQEAIIEKIRTFSGYSFAIEVLVAYLDFDHAKEFLNLEATDTWYGRPLTEATAKTDSLEYLEFGMGKAEDHRGLSANRTIDKLGAWAWLLERDDVTTAMEAADYPNYGVPKLHAFATTMGPEYVKVWCDNLSNTLENMAKGIECVQDCDEGCN